jgi:hypothetical protein
LDGHPDKRAIFGKDGDVDFTSSFAVELKAQVAAIIDDASRGVRHYHVYAQFFKDELISEEAYARGKLRLISCCPLAWFVAMRMYFMAFQVATARTCITNHTAIGLNPYTRWMQLTRMLRSKGRWTIAGDFKRYDASEQPQIHDAILRGINRWYDDGHDRTREVLWMEVTHSRQLTGLGSMRTQIVQWVKAMPSGNPLTSLINSLYNLTLFNLCWNHLCPVAARNCYFEYCYLIVMGDDNIQNVKDEVIGWWNQDTITRAMARYHMVYTDDAKGTDTRLRTLEECTFCQRSFREEPLLGSVGPLALTTALYIPYYCHKNPDIFGVMGANVELALGELSLHGDATWSQWAPRIQAACKSVGYSLKGPLIRAYYVQYILSYVPPYCYELYTGDTSSNSQAQDESLTGCS